MGKKRKAAEGTRRDIGPEGGRQVQQSHPELVGMLGAAVPGEASELNGGKEGNPVLSMDHSLCHLQYRVLHSGWG